MSGEIFLANARWTCWLSDKHQQNSVCMLQWVVDRRIRLEVASSIPSQLWSTQLLSCSKSSGDPKMATITEIWCKFSNPWIKKIISCSDWIAFCGHYDTIKFVHFMLPIGFCFAFLGQLKSNIIANSLPCENIYLKKYLCRIWMMRQSKTRCWILWA